MLRDQLAGKTKIKNIMSNPLGSKCYRLFLGITLTFRQWLKSQFHTAN